MLRDPDDLALTTAIIAMAHSLGITVVVEGVGKDSRKGIGWGIRRVRRILRGC